MPIESTLTTLSNFFANPAGLIALTALIPLAIFYLIKREPDEQMMPSFMFFHDEEDGKTMQSSYRKLMRNLVLLLHIIAIIGFALAFAEPLVQGAGSPDHSVLILDRSGSMKGDYGQTKDFLVDNLGEKNTVIAVDDDAELLAERVSKSRARGIIEKLELSDTETNIASGLRKAQRYEGKIFIGSDLDQATDSSDIEDILDRYRSERKEFKTIDLSRRNSWGIVDINVGTENTSIEIKNFESIQNTVTLTHSGEERTISLDGNSMKNVVLESNPGTNTVRLQEDKFATDNRAYFTVPETNSFDVVFIADEKNPYLMKAFELIEFTNISYRSPPVEGKIDADMYIIGETDRIISETTDRISENVRNGDSMVIFGPQDISRFNFQNLPFRDKGEYVNKTVDIREPVNVNLGEMRIRSIRKTGGRRLSPGTNALLRSSYGNGELLLYNIPDGKFNQDFLYPVFWKKVAADMLGRSSIEELNKATGSTIEADSVVTPTGKELSGRVELKNQGFYNTSKGTVSANMLSEDESLRDETDSGSGTETSDESSKASAKTYVLIFLLALIVFETAYLYRIGDLR